MQDNKDSSDSDQNSQDKQNSQSDLRNIMAKYSEKLKKNLDDDYTPVGPDTVTKEYEQFREHFLPAHLSTYEKACNISEKILKISPDKKKLPVMNEAIDICHLHITPSGVASFAILGPLIFMVLGSLLGFGLFNSGFFVFIFVIVGFVLMLIFGKVPEMLANNWRLQASNQMVLCTFYVVTYMRHTSNLENAIRFASDHLTGPLALDMKKVIWNIETEKYKSVKESLDIYLQTWKKWNMEFIESFHLIESSLFESSEARRLDLLDKSLDVILDETYEKMMHYAQNLKAPITMLNMLGVILPILGLVILPLVVSFMEGVRWYHLAMIYNVLLPIGVYYMGKNILSKRPTGYGDTDVSEYNPEMKKKRNFIINLGPGLEIQISPIWFSILIVFVFLIIGLSPIILYAIDPAFDIPIMDGKFSLFGYREAKDNPENIIGPYGIGASLLSLAIPLGFGLGIGLYYRNTSKNILKIRNKAKKLEKEFASALFQLGNRLGDGLPAEIAFERVAETMDGTTSGEFFAALSANIRRLGMNIKQALFDKKIGALHQFPSKLIESSMKVLIESAKKGPKIAASALMNIARYVKEIHRVNERLKDLLADTISSMKAQISFLTPAIAGIVIGITSMVTTILSKLGEQMQRIKSSGGEGMSSGGLDNLFGDGIPTYYFQIIVGIYVVQIIYILTVMANGIENGSDKLNERYMIGQNMLRSQLLYTFIALAIMLVFNMIAGVILESTMSVAG